MTLPKHIECEFCDGTTETRMIDYEMPFKGTKHKFIGIEAEVCPKCGEIYIPGDKVLEMQRTLEREPALT
jgi:YgiT-type zinc finger domain-containing protein